jgi:hypothetical protein
MPSPSGNQCGPCCSPPRARDRCTHPQGSNLESSKELLSADTCWFPWPNYRRCGPCHHIFRYVRPFGALNLCTGCGSCQTQVAVFKWGLRDHGIPWYYPSNLLCVVITLLTNTSQTVSNGNACSKQCTEFCRLVSTSSFSRLIETACTLVKY